MTDEAPPRAARALPARPSLEHLRKEAKRRLRLLRQSNPIATLAGAQRDVARDYGFASWRRLVAQVGPALTAGPDLPYDWGEAFSQTLSGAEALGGLDAAEAEYRALIAHKPTGLAHLEATFALFLATRRNKGDEARLIFARLLRTPTPDILAHYAGFARAIGDADADRQEMLYQQALALADDPLALNHYACFLWYERQDRENALRWFRKAAERGSAYPLVDAAAKGTYAVMLWAAGDAVAAETWFRLARARSRRDVPMITLTFAALLTATNRAGEGLALLPEVLGHPQLRTLPPNLARWHDLVAWFLRYAHGDDTARDLALREIRTGLAGWRPFIGEGPDLARNAEAAAIAGHPDAGLVAALARILAPRGKGIDDALAALEHCPGWRAGAGSQAVD
ncbi:hypothetical protein [Nitrospirillum iridis]|uniref:Tetratricopeptide (TPR) repeat protein n=1 Tax=Nitrospirillum iridis TaxID=765888 RepID=A0A7X0AUG5_9PROT|nr:hypothetical protein [Nitrospirillum iridis]MBB6250313.1 tetratricopeptide (TPR) repeat protein [Nitrospirillum iridis]